MCLLHRPYHMSLHVNVLHTKEKTNVIIIKRFLSMVTNLRQAAGAEGHIERGTPAIIQMMMRYVWVTDGVPHKLY